MTRALVFGLATAGCFHAWMTASLVLHEVVGHGFASLALGGRFEGFRVEPGFAGAARTSGVPAHLEWAVTWGGIGVNALTGSVVLLFARRAARGGSGGYAITWLVATELGHALGYVLAGLAFGRGDARTLARLGVLPRAALGAAVLALLVMLAAWTVRRLVRAVEGHARPARPGERALARILGLLVPVAVLLLFAVDPGPFTLGQRLVVDGLGVGLLGSALAVTRAAREPHAAPLGPRSVVAWSAAGCTTWTLCAVWLADGVTF